MHMWCSFCKLIDTDLAYCDSDNCNYRSDCENGLCSECNARDALPNESKCEYCIKEGE